MAKWSIQKSEYIVSDKWLKLRSDSCLTEDGKVIEPFYVFEYKDWVNCLVIDSHLNVLMTRHYRHGIQKEVLEIIGGSIEDSDDSLESGIKRELEEELGYTGGKIFKTGIHYSNPSNHTNKTHSFFAFGGSINQEQNLEASENLRIVKMKFSKLLEIIQKGEEILQSLHIANLFYTFNFISNSDNPEFTHLKQLIKKFYNA